MAELKTPGGVPEDYTRDFVRLAQRTFEVCRWPAPDRQAVMQMRLGDSYLRHQVQCAADHAAELLLSLAMFCTITWLGVWAHCLHMHRVTCSIGEVYV